MAIKKSDEWRAIKERARAATGPDLELDAEIALLRGWGRVFAGGQTFWVDPKGVQFADPVRFSTSLDLVLVLAEEQFPGWHWRKAVTIEGRPVPNLGVWLSWYASCATPALTVLCAMALDKQLLAEIAERGARNG